MYEDFHQLNFVPQPVLRNDKKGGLSFKHWHYNRTDVCTHEGTRIGVISVAVWLILNGL